MIGIILLVLATTSGRVLRYDIEIEQVVELEEEWVEFKRQHNKNYALHEDKLRFEIFKSNCAQIMAHNKLYEGGKVSYKMGVNRFTDMTIEERQSLYANLKYDRSNRRENHIEHESRMDEYPKSVDWRTKNVVTPVKDQGNCGSCYAFSAVGSIEGQYAQKYNKLVSFSEQNLMDCSSDYGNQGCNGGYMKSCFDYVKKNGGLDTEEMYPYKGEDSDQCFYRPFPFTLTSYTSIQSGNETDLMVAAAEVGPISVGIQVKDSFFSYSEGIYFDDKCGTFLNHGVLVVGYGVEDDMDYWLVKNSWGESWGMNGYVKMSRNRGNNCGIATDSSYPNL